jgi:hypothetical protein
MMAKKAQWLMLSAEQKRQKYVEMYSANLEVIALQEEEVNKKYDKRNEALDKIQAANDAITKQNQAQLSLSEALSRGDLSGAVRAAKEMESLSATQAVEARRAAMEKARQDELGKITTDVNGVLMTRKDIEDQIKAANEATVLAKAAQLEKEIAIGKEAEKNRSAILAWAGSKDNPANGTIGGGTGGGTGGGSVTPVKPVVTPLTPAQQAAAAQSNAIAAIRADDKKFDPKNIKGKTYDNPITTGIPDNSSIPETKKLFSLGQYVKLPKGVYMQTMVVKPNKIVELTFSSEPNAAKIKTKGNSVKLDTDMGGNLPPYQRFASGGMVMPKYMSVGGQAIGTDTVPAMLTPGEFIVSQPAVEDFGVNNLKAINNGTYGGNSVYNYSVNVNAGSNASADDIARAVMNKINEVDARRVRGNNF